VNWLSVKPLVLNKESFPPQISLKGRVKKFLWGASGTSERASAGGKIGGVKRNFGAVEHFIRGVREISGG
jgi:hypothetical protein